MDAMCEIGVNVEFGVSFDESGLFSGFVGILGVRWVGFGVWESG